MLGEALVVAGAGSSAGDPGMGALDDPAPWQDVEPVLARWLGDDLDGDAELAGRPVAPAADVALVGPDVGQAVAAGGAGGLEHERGPGPVLGARGVTTTAMRSPAVSVRTCRLRPLTFLCRS